MMRAGKFALVLAFMVGLPMAAQWRQQPTTGSTPMRLHDRTNYAGLSGMGPQLDAELVDEHKNAAEKRAVVRANVRGVDLISPAQSGVESKRTEAYLSYRLDQQPEIKTADKEQKFENLSAGEHTIIVQLASADGHQVGAPVVLKLKVR